MVDPARLAHAPHESKRFGLQVWRASAIGAATSVLSELIDSAADVAIYRLPVGVSHPVAALAQSGFDLVHAGVLVDYTLDLERYVPRALRDPALQIRRVQAADDNALAALVDAVFAGYVTHYAGNPLFDAGSAIAGYREWTLRARHDTAQAACWVAHRDDRLVAFAMCTLDVEHGICIGGLYGVLPGDSGRGVFSDLMRETQSHFKREGYREMRMSTKADNLVSQKVFAREGFHLYAAFDTLHVNALLSAGLDTAITRSFRFDDDFCTMPLQRVLADALDVNGTRPLIEVAQVVLAAAPTHVQYTLTVTAPHLPRADGLRRAIARVRAPDGTLVLLAHASARDTVTTATAPISA